MSIRPMCLQRVEERCEPPVCTSACMQRLQKRWGGAKAEAMSSYLFPDSKLALAIKNSL